MLTVCRVPERVRNKYECVTGPQPERVRSIFAGVNATRTSGTGTGPERDRNGTGTQTGTGVNKALEQLNISVNRDSFFQRLISARSQVVHGG